MREKVKEVMRYAGPRMIWRHPWLALMHVVDKRYVAPPKPSATARAAAARTAPAASTAAPATPAAPCTNAPASTAVPEEAASTPRG
jgi:hypothetical protein